MDDSEQRRGAVLVTGAARRIGAVIARTLAAEGWRVVLHYNRSEAEAEAVAAAIREAGGRCGLVQADLAERGAVEALVPRCVERFGTLDCLVNNASSFVKDDAETLTWDSFEAAILPNLAAPLLLSRDFARQFGAREGGCIINMLDQKIAHPSPDFLSYTVSKVALAGVTEMLAMAFSPRIRVCGVAPGMTLISGKQSEEGFQRAWRSPPLGRSSTPEELARCVQFILATPSITGQTIVLDGGESLRAPKRG